MTDVFVIPDPVAWANAIAELRAAKADYAGQAVFRSAEATSAVERLIRAQETILDLPSPDVRGVVEKLNVIWEKEHGNDRESFRKLGAIGDLTRLYLTQG